MVDLLGALYPIYFLVTVFLVITALSQVLRTSKT
jgi:hypothetical protein